jgi:hypothetical protein
VGPNTFTSSSRRARAIVGISISDVLTQRLTIPHSLDPNVAQNEHAANDAKVPRGSTCNIGDVYMLDTYLARTRQQQAKLNISHSDGSFCVAIAVPISSCWRPQIPRTCATLHPSNNEP